MCHILKIILSKETFSRWIREDSNVIYGLAFGSTRSTIVAIRVQMAMGFPLIAWDYLHA